MRQPCLYCSKKLTLSLLKKILGKAFILVHGAHLIEFFSSRIFSPPPPPLFSRNILDCIEFNYHRGDSPSPFLEAFKRIKKIYLQT